MTSYQPMLLGFPGKPKVPKIAPDGRGATGLLMTPKSEVLYIVVALAPIWWEFGISEYGQGSDPGSIEWQGGNILFPIPAGGIPGDFDAVRVWRFLETGPEPQVSVTVA